MKTIITCILISIGVQMAMAQEFVQNNSYTIKQAIQNKQQEYPPYTIDIMSTTEVPVKVATFMIEDTELLDGIFISTLDTPGLVGIKEVIKVEVEYLACCAHVEAHYFMITDTDDCITLPMLENVYCEIGAADMHYTFPNQNYGISGNILKIEKHYNTTAKVDYVTLQQCFAWEDDSYEMSENMENTLME